MARIDTTNWGTFKVGEVVNKINLKCKKKNFHKVFDVSLVRTPEFNLPLVNAKHYNNGIMYYGRECDFEYAKMAIDIVQNGASAVGDVYAQPQKTGVLEDAYLVKPIFENISVQALFYLSTVIEKCVKQYFSYDEKCTWDKVKNKEIRLPVDLLGNPDWKFMETYIKELEQSVDHTVLALSAIKKSKSQKIDLAKFKRFHLYDDGLFIIDSGTKLDKFRMSNNYPTINFVGRANTNNGVTDYIDEIKGLKPYAAGLMTISLGGEYLGSCFIQDKPFYTSQNVNVLIPQNDMSYYCKTYIATMIFREGRSHYKAFVDELNRHMKTDFTIPLPIDESGNINWKYMEQYMMNIENRVMRNLRSLV